MQRARDIMTRDVVVTTEKTPVYKAVRLLLENEITGIPVVDHDMVLVGILTEKDVLKLYHAPEYGKKQTVDDFMTQPAVYFDEDESLLDICNCLIDYTFRRVPVTSRGKVVGIISRPDIIRCILELSGDSAVKARDSK